MDGIEELRGVVVLAATNRPDLLDPALLRAGRFEVRLDLPMPDEVSRRSIFAVHTRAKPLADDVDLDRLTRETEGFSGADIEAVCRRAAMEAISRQVESGAEDVEGLRLQMPDFELAVGEIHRLHGAT
jgi:transitional endoplasmic reticulum ATPase